MPPKGDAKGGGAEDHARYKQYDYRAVRTPHLRPTRDNATQPLGSISPSHMRNP